MMNKRGVSPVVATVLLLVLTIIIGGIVFSVVIPFVNDKLGESKACLDVFDGIEFPESKFNCFISNSTANITGFSVKVNKEGISAARVALTDTTGGSDVYDIINGTTALANLRMVGGSSTSPIVFPAVGGQRSYVVSNKVYEKGEISALTASGETCSVADIIKFEPCSGVSL